MSNKYYLVYILRYEIRGASGASKGKEGCCSKNSKYCSSVTHVNCASILSASHKSVRKIVIHSTSVIAFASRFVPGGETTTCGAVNFPIPAISISPFNKIFICLNL